ncbi:MAG: hypothetical protein HC913_21420 [Microscillaceae bacterium]|nr:hypothetical protein [Microscillaceae bacterium]
MRKGSNNSNRKLMQELEAAIKDLKKIQRDRDKLVEDFNTQKTNFKPGQ